MAPFNIPSGLTDSLVPVGRLLACAFFMAVTSCGGTPAPPEPSGSRAFADLVQQVDMGPRIAGSQAVQDCRSFITSELQAAGADVGRQDFAIEDPYSSGKLLFANILGHFYVDRPHRVLLGAHYDSRPWADQDSLTAHLPVPGANDGASGVAVLLEVARCLQAWDPGVGVDLVFFDGEDYGREGDLDHYLLGSKYFVEIMAPYRPRQMILLDMVGGHDLRIPMERYSLQMAPNLTRLIFAVADSLKAPGFVSEPGKSVYDDHIPFLQNGIPAVDLIDFDYSSWHTVEDTPDKCSPESLASVARVLLHVLMRLGS